jgi:hypothetical protein
MTRTHAAIESVARPLRRSSDLGWAFAVVAAIIAGLAAAAWLLRLGVGAPALVALGAWVVIAVAAALVGWIGQRARRELTTLPIARALESSGAARQGALRAQLERHADGTSDGLAAAADQHWSTEVASRGHDALAPVGIRLRRRAMVLAGTAFVAATALAFARPAGNRAALLWHPGEAMDLLRAPVRLRAEPDVVDRGREVTLHLEAVGQRSATLWSRAPGQPWSAMTVLLDSLGLAMQQVGPVESDLYFRLSSGSRGSDTVHVRVRLPAFLGALKVTAHYPKYLNLEDESLPLNGDTLLIPAGTVLETEGEASTAIREAAWTSRGKATVLDPAGRRFRGRMVPPASGSWVLALVSEDGTTISGDPIELPLVVVPDSAPVIEVPSPGVDTIAPLDLKIPLVIDAQDDHGLTAIELVSRTRAGSVVQAVPLEGDPTTRALVEAMLDLSSRGLAPGDTVRYLARATDNSPARQAGSSREFIVIVPTEADQRDAQRQATAAAQQRLDSMVAASRRLERQAEDLAAERARAQQQRGDQQAMGFDEARKSQQVAKNQEELLRQADELRETLDALEDAARRGEQPDTALARRLSEISEQLNQALTPELREKLAELQKALQTLDPEAAREALKQLAEAQQALREALERSRELFKRAALEGELNALEQDAKDIAKEQQEWNQQVARSDSNAAAAGEQELAKQADSLASGLDRAAKQMEQQDAQQQTQAAAQKARKAAQQMRQAAGSAQKGQRQQAKKQGEQAEQDMEEVQKETAEQRDKQQEEWKQEVLDALDRALAETARLSEQQLSVSEGFRRGSTLGSARSEQATVEESAQKLLSQLTTLAGKNALVSPQIAVAVAMARREMGLAREAVSSASPNLREAAERAGEAVDALNAAAFQMVRARDDVEGASSGSGLAEAMERMTQMAQQQGQLSQQAGGMLPMAGQASIQQQLQQLAAQQRSIAREMERMRAEGQIPAAEELAEEARELARKLEARQFDRETVERQERLFKKMLDAGRTLRGEEEDERKERQSTSAKEGEIKLPPALRQRLGGDGLRFPTWDELQRLSPEERRLVTEYFRRLSSGSQP